MGHESPEHDRLLAKGYLPVTRAHTGLVYQDPNNPNNYIECVGSSTHIFVREGSVDIAKKIKDFRSNRRRLHRIMFWRDLKTDFQNFVSKCLKKGEQIDKS